MDFEQALVTGFWGFIIVYPILQFNAVKRMHGAWRVLAFLPLILMIFVFFVTIAGYYQRSNLWPIFLIFVAPLVLVYLAILLTFHSVFTRGKNEK